MLDFSGFARSGYRSDFELRKSIFRSKYGCGTDSLVFAAGYLFLNVNYPPTCFDPKRYCNSVVLLYIFDITCISIIFATYFQCYLSSKNTLHNNDLIAILSKQMFRCRLRPCVVPQGGRHEQQREKQIQFFHDIQICVFIS